MKKAFDLLCLLALTTTLLNCNGTEKKKEAKEAVSKLPVLTMIDSSSYDFGTIQEGQIVEHTFNFRNDGPYPLILNNITSSCGCTTPEWPKEPINPKALSSIKVRFDSKNKSGPQVKTITVYANTEPAYSELRLRGVVNEAPKSQPEK